MIANEHRLKNYQRQSFLHLPSTRGDLCFHISRLCNLDHHVPMALAPTVDHLSFHAGNKYLNNHAKFFHCYIQISDESHLSKFHLEPELVVA